MKTEWLEWLILFKQYESLQKVSDICHVTPPMWATLSTGAYANVHGITGYNRQGSELNKIVGNFDSRNQLLFLQLLSLKTGALMYRKVLENLSCFYPKVLCAALV